MRVLVMGTGGLGGYYGGVLARNGHDVTFVARGAHLDAIRQRGLALRQAGRGETDVLHPAQAVATPDEAAGGADFDLILFTVKAYDTETAAAALKSVVGKSTAVLTLQNGVDAVDQLGAAIGSEHVLAGTTRISTTLGEPGVIVQNTPFSRLEMGELSGGVTPRIEAIADAFRAGGIKVLVSDNPLREVWNKFIMIAPHATITSACGQPVGPIRATPEGAALYRQLIEEVVAVERATAGRLPADAADRTYDFIMNLPAGAKTSMQFDFERQKRVELEQLTGSVVRRGQALNVPTPGFTTLYAVLKVRANEMIDASGSVLGSTICLAAIS
jgi:2-dehydropantoate 2-reductase